MPRSPESTAAVSRVAKLDGRTRIVAASRILDPGWQPIEGALAFTRTTARDLRSQGFTHVELRRRFRRARVPLNWLGV